MIFERYGIDGANGFSPSQLGEDGGDGQRGANGRWGLGGTIGTPPPGQGLEYVAVGGRGGAGGNAGNEPMRSRPGGAGGDGAMGGVGSIAATGVIYSDSSPTLTATGGAGGFGGSGSFLGARWHSTGYDEVNGPGGDAADGGLGLVTMSRSTLTRSLGLHMRSVGGAGGAGGTNGNTTGVGLLPGDGADGGDAETSLTGSAVHALGHLRMNFSAVGGAGQVSGRFTTNHVSDGGDAAVRVAGNVFTAEAAPRSFNGITLGVEARGGHAGYIDGVAVGRGGLTSVAILNNRFVLDDVDGFIEFRIYAHEVTGGAFANIRIEDNVFDGGGGYDTIQLDVQNRFGPVENLRYVDFDMARNTIVDIEQVTGSYHADVIKGDANGNHLVGQTGDDQLLGRGGDDRLVGGEGDDRLDGGDGVDTASYADAQRGVRVSLTPKGAQDTLALGRDTLIDIENLEGSGYADALTGSNLGNLLLGGDGDDQLDGHGGLDTLEGGYGLDRLTGGLGADVFRYRAWNESIADRTLRDVILDFRRAEGDKIDLSQVDLDRWTDGRQAFVFRSRDKFDGTPGALIVTKVDSGWLAQGDVNGDRIADFGIVVRSDARLDAQDFLF
jgi:Ca2+-binding RTX toxin-like protein